MIVVETFVRGRVGICHRRWFESWDDAEAFAARWRRYTSTGDYIAYVNERFLSQAEIAAMREWAMDCEWDDYDSFDDMLDQDIVNGIERHYDGGVEGFRRDASRRLPCECEPSTHCNGRHP